MSTLVSKGGYKYCFETDQLRSVIKYTEMYEVPKTLKHISYNGRQ